MGSRYPHNVRRTCENPKRVNGYATKDGGWAGGLGGPGLLDPTANHSPLWGATITTRTTERRETMQTPVREVKNG